MILFDDNPIVYAPSIIFSDSPQITHLTAGYTPGAVDPVGPLDYPAATNLPRQGSGGTRPDNGGEDMRIMSRARRVLRLARTIGQALPPTLEHIRLNKAAGTYKAYHHHAGKHIRPAIGSLGLDEVTPYHVQTMILDAYRSTPGAARQTVRTLGSFYGLWSLWQWVPHGYNPTRGLKVPTSEGRGRVACDTEMLAIWRRIEHHQRHGSRTQRDAADILALIALTGTRKGVYMHLEWSEVDLDGGRLSLQKDSGRKRARHVILPAAAVDLLRVRADTRGMSGRVFPHAWKVRELWEAIRLEIGAPDLTIHDLRRTWSTLLGEAGIEAEDAAAVLGQKSVAVQRKHYRHLREARLREIAELGARQMRGGRVQ